VSHTLVSDATCEGCIYYRRLYESGTWSGPPACHYCYDTGMPRGCEIVGCTRKHTKPSAAERRALKKGKFNPINRTNLKKATKSD
jgi:hypothetical protein